MTNPVFRYSTVLSHNESKTYGEETGTYADAGANPVPQSALAAALDALILAESAIELQEDDITVQRLVKLSGWHAHRSQKVIEGWVLAGLAEYIGDRREPSRGSMVKAWRLV